LTLYIFSCTENRISEKIKTSNITVQLPFESSNYENNTNFILFDRLGKKCIPTLDTVTKGGGTIEYKNLQNGIYSYKIRTPFNDTITRQLNIDSSKYVQFYKECYDERDVISIEDFKSFKKLNLITETFTETNNGFIDEIIFEKEGNQYQIYSRLRNDKKWTSQFTIDSSKLLNALLEFETRIIGLREVGMNDNDYSFGINNSVHIRCDNKYLVVYDTRTKELNDAIRKLKSNLFN
jgi:hypothetical protein